MLIICILANKFQLNQSLIKMLKGICEIVHSFNIGANNNYESANTKDPIKITSILYIT